MFVTKLIITFYGGGLYFIYMVPRDGHGFKSHDFDFRFSKIFFFDDLNFSFQNSI